MIAILLAGGFGHRFNDKTKKIPKPLIKVNNIPLIMYVIKNYVKHKINNFIICSGYKHNEFIKFFSKQKDFKKISKNNFNICLDKKKILIKIVNTGVKTETGGRLLKIKKYLIKYTFFLVSYSDVISDIDITKQIKFFKKKKKLAVLAAVTTPSRFGILKINKNQLIKSFDEKPKVNSQKINGGFFILSKKVLKYIESSKTILEQQTMKFLCKKNQLVAFKHQGLWQPVDNLKDKIAVEKILKNERD